jgi:hypothetical protein
VPHPRFVRVGLGVFLRVPHMQAHPEPRRALHVGSWVSPPDVPLQTTCHPEERLSAEHEVRRRTRRRISTSTPPGFFAKARISHRAAKHAAFSFRGSELEFTLRHEGLRHHARAGKGLQPLRTPVPHRTHTTAQSTPPSNSSPSSFPPQSLKTPPAPVHTAAVRPKT